MSAVTSAHALMDLADYYVGRAESDLVRARSFYFHADLPAPVREARVAALDAKIAALRDLHVGPEAHPWKGDRK